ncbi:hypothetical protein [Cellulomonas endophytica]|uniref:hypothetical protein n=1 Tax=Cellulomonas endophytica TaxID=2494735 RepID=UPI001010F069|nr:hypothetical protein [Cellulomonas endophytica]
MSWTARALVAAVLTALAGLLVLGHGPYAGRHVLAVTVSHGVNSGDLVVLALWAVGVLALLPWRRRATPGRSQGRAPGTEVPAGPLAGTGAPSNGHAGAAPRAGGGLDEGQAASSASTASTQPRFAARQPSSSSPSRQ